MTGGVEGATGIVEGVEVATETVVVAVVVFSSAAVVAVVAACVVFAAPVVVALGCAHASPAGKTKNEQKKVEKNMKLYCFYSYFCKCAFLRLMPH